MARLFDLVDARGSLPGLPRRRIWLLLGMPVALGGGVRVLYFAERQDLPAPAAQSTGYLPNESSYSPYLLVRHRDGRNRQVMINSGEWVDLSGAASMVVIPRALENDRCGRPLQCLVELVALRDPRTQGRRFDA